MIPQAIIREYLAGERDDHRWLKDLPAEDVDGMLASVEPRPKLFPGLRLHQKVGVALGLAYPQFAFWYDMGLGKTILALELLRYWMQTTKRIRRALVLVTSDKAYPTWRKQIERFGIELPYVMLDGSSEAKWDMLDRFGDGLVFATYPGLLMMVAAKARIKQKNRLMLDADRIDELIDGVGALVLDESTKAAGNSLTNELCRYIADRVDIRYALAGRPFGRDPIMLFEQQRIIDGGASLGEARGLFREAFFTAKQNRWGRGRYSRDYKFKRKLMPQLMRMSRHRSLSYADHECGEVPDWTPIIEEVGLPEEAQLYYQRIVRQIIAARGNLREMENAFLRMRQLSSGFMGFRDDDGARAEIAFDDNPKLDRLLELLDSLPDGRKALVFYDFTWSGRRIAEELEKRKREAIWLWSGTGNPQGELLRFCESPSCTIAVLQNRVGAYSLDGLQVANYSLFYESPVPVIDREQAERRVRRQGQTRRVFQYDLVVRGTLDRRVLDFHREGDDLLQALRADPEKILANIDDSA